MTNSPCADIFTASKQNVAVAVTLKCYYRWTEFNEALQEATSQRTLPSLCFSGWSKNQDGHHGFWLTETFSIYSLQPPEHGIQRNLTLTGFKISTSSTKFMYCMCVFFLTDRKTKIAMHPAWPLIAWDIFLCNRWTEFNEPWQEARTKVVFSGWSKNQDGHNGL